MAEEGLAGQSNKAGAAVTPDVWNDFANPNEGTSFVAHGHLRRARYARCAMLGLHYFHAWSQDDRANNVSNGMLIDGSRPDAKLDIAAADLRLTAGALRTRLRGRVVHQGQQRA